MSLNTILATTPNTTSGYVLRATGTTIGNSTIQDDGTNVAIGTTPGTYKFNVSGSGSMINIIGASSGDIATGFRIGRGASLGAEIYDNPADNITTFNTTGGLNLRVGGSNRLTIASTGAATFSSTITSGDITTNGNNKGLYFNGTRNAILGNAATEEVVIATANATRMTINSSGNVGIGVNPQARFEVLGYNGNLRMYGQGGITENQISSNVYFNGSSWVRDNASYGAAAIALESSNGQILFYTTAATSGFPTERMRITNNGYLRLAGAGIQFNGDTSDANSLDDYEEGSWTPTIENAGSVSYSRQFGRYTKIGNIVYVSGKISITGSNQSGNAIILGGLPFSSADVSDASQRNSIMPEGDWNGLGTQFGKCGLRVNGSNFQGVKDNGSGGSAYLTYADFSSSFNFNFHTFYYV